MRKYKHFAPLATFTYFFVIVICPLSIIGCRKADKIEELPTSPNAITVTEKFFTVPETTNPAIKTIAQSIFRQNENGKFVEVLVKKIGYPNWAKAIVATPSGLLQIENADSSYNQIIYLPFA